MFLWKIIPQGKKNFWTPKKSWHDKALLAKKWMIQKKNFVFPAWNPEDY